MINDLYRNAKHGQLFTQDEIHELHTCIIRTGISPQALLQELDPAIRAILEQSAFTEADHLLALLASLNRLRHVDGSIPFKTVLRTAALLAGPRDAREVFDRFSSAIDTKARGLIGPSQIRKGTSFPALAATLTLSVLATYVIEELRHHGSAQHYEDPAPTSSLRPVHIAVLPDPTTGAPTGGTDVHRSGTMPEGPAKPLKSFTATINCSMPEATLASWRLLVDGKDRATGACPVNRPIPFTVPGQGTHVARITLVISGQWSGFFASSRFNYSLTEEGISPQTVDSYPINIPVEGNNMPQGCNINGKLLECEHSFATN